MEQSKRHVPPWSDRLPWAVVGAFLRRPMEAHFRDQLHGEVHQYSEEHGLHLHLLRPSRQNDEGNGQQSSRPGCVVFLHGGAWVLGAPFQFYAHARAVAQDLGLAVAHCEYRLLLTHPSSKLPFDAVSDAGRCVRFLHDRAEAFGLDGRKFVLAGFSSGGHLAAMTALEGTDLDLAGLVLMNPVLDLRFSAGWSRKKFLVWLGSRFLHARYGPGALEEKSPMHQVRKVPYPTLIMHGQEDTLVPVTQSEAFQSEMQRSGNSCTLVPFPEVGHEFLQASPASFSRCISLLGGFLSSLGVVDAMSVPSC